MSATVALANTPERVAIRDAVQAICDRFDDDYWAARDRDHAFPFEFAEAFAAGGWIGIAMPQEFGGAGLGVTEAAIMMQVVGASAGAFAACSTVHINIFGLHSIVKHGTDAQRSERCLREMVVTQLPPVSREMILCYIAERALGLPKSY